MELIKMQERHRLELRKKCLRDLFSFCVAVMGYDDFDETLHGDLCAFLQGEGKRKQVTLPRSFIKTWTSSIAQPIWLTLPRKEEDEFPYQGAWNDKFFQLGPDMRVLIASYVISNSEKMISLIRQTYEANQTMQILFPEVIPDNFNKVRWSNQSACIRRPTNFTESTFEAAGIGGASTSRHYDLILEDDLIYAKKDDFSDQELQPDRDDIDKAIGWHKLATSLLVPGPHTRIYNVGTRWAEHDLVEYIWKNEKTYKVFQRGCVDLEELKVKGDWRLCRPSWPKMYGTEQLGMIADAQGPYMFSTQYLLQPSSPASHLFKREYLEFYRGKDELPKTMRIFTTVDLALWGDPSRKSDCNAVVLTCGWCDKHHMWILGYDCKRMDPSEVIMTMARHWETYSSERIGIEEVYYQKALAHFAREYMEEGKVPFMSIRGLKPENNLSKELRIRSLEPLACNRAIHCREDQKEWIGEFVGYIPNNPYCKKDLLDAAAYQIQIARPGKPLGLEVRKKPVGDIKFSVDMDEVMEKMMASGRGGKDRFGRPQLTLDPLTVKEGEKLVHASSFLFPEDESNFND